MSKRKSTASIPPFPDDIDRNYFGAWLSGFVDGEGCFYLKVHHRESAKRPLDRHLYFSILLRRDDISTLHRIQSYLGCGQVTLRDIPKKHALNANPQAEFKVIRHHDLQRIIVPQFERFPLQAKKARDFTIWRQAVALSVRVAGRRWRHVGGNRDGVHPKWTARDDAEFQALADALHAQRQYNAPAIDVPSRQVASGGLLFKID